MKNSVQKQQGPVPRGSKGSGFFSLRSISNYLKIVSSGASTVASTVRSAGASVASSIAGDDDADRDQVHWAGFDKLECEGNVLRQILLLGYRSGFQVWDVDEAHNVQQLVSRHEGPVSFLQMQKNPVPSKRSEDKFLDFRPLLVVVGDGSFPGHCNSSDAMGLPCNGSIGSHQDLGNESIGPKTVRFYSLRTNEYVHVLKFMSAVYSVRCSPRFVAVSLASQIQCFDAATLEREYNILTHPIVSGFPTSASVGYGPLAVGPRWLAYSGNPVAVSDNIRAIPQHMTAATGLPASLPNGSLMAQYAKESGRQIAAGIVTLGDSGYKKLSKYCSELLPDGNNSLRHGNTTFKTAGTVNGHVLDGENVGMVVVRDIVSKSVVVQFRAHRSPISALCFDPSGILLVTASIHGHNINIFLIMPSSPGSSLGSDAAEACVQLYRLQRGITNAVIQDITFSSDSQWIMISSSRGTSHLFAISPISGASKHHVDDIKHTINRYVPDGRAAVCHPNGTCPMKVNQQSLSLSGYPVTLSVVGRIKNGANGWKGAVTGAAAAATGRVSPLSGAIASAFHNCKSPGHYCDNSSLKTKDHFLVFSPSGSIIQYVVCESNCEDSGLELSGISTVSHAPLEADTKFVIEALEKWDVCNKRNRRDRGDNFDVYGEHGSGENTRLFHKGLRKATSVYPAEKARGTKARVGTEENHHLYISEAELQMHSACVPLWAKSEICFHAMIGENQKTDNDADLGGEIEIERILTHIIEARPRVLVPVGDHYQTPRVPQSRVNSVEDYKHGSLICQASGFSEDGRHTSRSSCSSVDGMRESATVNELPNGFNECSFGDLHTSTETHDYSVNSTEKQSANCRLEFVNNREVLKTEAQLEHVNSRDPEDGGPI